MENQLDEIEFGVIYANHSVQGMDEFQAEELETHLPKGQPFIIQVHMDRNAENHKRFFAFLNTAFAMQDFFDNKEVFRKYIQMKAGHFETMVTPRGDTLFIPKSIQWSKLKEPKFRVLFKACIDAFLKYYSEMSSREMTEDEFRRICDFD